jgi:hypothetical protein
MSWTFADINLRSAFGTLAIGFVSLFAEGWFICGGLEGAGVAGPDGDACAELGEFVPAWLAEPAERVPAQA